MIKNLDQFTRRMDTISTKIDENLERNIRKAALKIHGDITLATPVITGNLRRNTNIENGQADLTDYGKPGGANGGESGAIAARLAMQRAQSVIKKHKPGQTVHITNPTEYAVHVEDGTAKFAGRKFFARGVQSGIAALRKAKILE